MRFRQIDLGIAGILLFCALAHSGPAVRTQRAAQQNRPPLIEWIKPNRIEFQLCPIVEFEPGYILNLEVKAGDPDGDSITYHYFVSAGQILGEGSHVRWDLRKALGHQKVVVEAIDNRGGKTSGVAEINVVIHTACHLPCTVLAVSGPSTVVAGEIATFAASVTGPVPKTKLEYLWSQRNGEIDGGQGTPDLRIKATGMPGAEVKVTVSVRGLDPACNSQASARARIQTPED
jgi:hypothetical protein